jgi:hypothetical protein
VVTGAPLGDHDGDGFQLHHRRPSGRGGTSRTNQDTLPNVICLLPRVHLFGSPRIVLDGVAGRSVHGSPAWSRPLGLLLSSHVEEPGSVPVRVRGMWVFLDDAGGWMALG